MEQKMQIAQIAQIVGLPEEKIAQMIQLIRNQGLSDAQLDSMIKMAIEKGVEPRQIITLLGSMDVSEEVVLQVLEAQGVVEGQLLEELRREYLPSKAYKNAAKKQKEQARWKSWGKKTAIIGFWLAVWELLDRLMDNRLILSGPFRTLQALMEQIVESDFWLICGASLGRIALGFLLSFAVGFLLALLSHRVKRVRDLLEPIISLLRTIPAVSIIIMLLIWVGAQWLTVFLCFCIVLPLIYTNMVTGFDSVDKQMLEMARTYRLSKWRTFLYIYRPAFMPFLISGSKISLGMSWKSGIMAEVLATPSPSIGKEMTIARTFLDTPDLFAWTVVVMILSVLFEKLFLELLRRAGRPLGGFLGRRG